MKLVTLQPVEGAQKKVDLKVGKTIIGRGPLLECADKKVSRNHALLEVQENGDVFLTPTHVNPCFFLPNDSKGGFEVLKKDHPQRIRDGDSFSLLPNSFRYRVIISDVANYDAISTAEEKKADQKNDKNDKKKDDVVNGESVKEDKANHKQVVEPQDNGKPLNLGNKDREDRKADADIARDLSKEKSSPVKNGISTNANKRARDSTPSSRTRSENQATANHKRGEKDKDLNNSQNHDTSVAKDSSVSSATLNAANKRDSMATTAGAKTSAKESSAVSSAANAASSKKEASNSVTSGNNVKEKESNNRKDASVNKTNNSSPSVAASMKTSKVAAVVKEKATPEKTLKEKKAAITAEDQRKLDNFDFDEDDEEEEKQLKKPIKPNKKSVEKASPVSPTKGTGNSLTVVKRKEEIRPSGLSSLTSPPPKKKRATSPGLLSSAAPTSATASSFSSARSTRTNRSLIQRISLDDFMASDDEWIATYASSDEERKKAKRRQSVSKRKSAATGDSESDEDNWKGAKAKKTKGKRKAKRSRGSDSEDAESEEEVKPVKKRGRPAGKAKATPAKKKKPQSEDEEDDDSEEEASPPIKKQTAAARKPVATPPKKKVVRRRKSNMYADNEEEFQKQLQKAIRESKKEQLRLEREQREGASASGKA